MQYTVKIPKEIIYNLYFKKYVQDNHVPDIEMKVFSEIDSNSFETTYETYAFIKDIDEAKKLSEYLSSVEPYEHDTIFPSFFDYAKNPFSVSSVLDLKTLSDPLYIRYHKFEKIFNNWSFLIENISGKFCCVEGLQDKQQMTGTLPVTHMMFELEEDAVFVDTVLHEMEDLLSKRKEEGFTFITGSTTFDSTAIYVTDQNGRPTTVSPSSISSSNIYTSSTLTADNFASINAVNK